MKRYPLKRPPGRAAGESLAERRNALIGSVMEYGMVAAMLTAIAIVEWFQYAFLMPPQPWAFSAVAVIAIGYAIYRVAQIRPVTKRMKLGIDGERSVGEELDKLRVCGYEVFHDFVGEGFNIDHVLIGPAGIFTVETKTRSKPQRGRAEIRFDGQSIRISNGASTVAGVTQARAQAAALGEILRHASARSIWVRPVIVFPGWWIDDHASERSEVWVMNPERLVARLGREARVLGQEELTLFASHLRRTIEEHSGQAE